MKKSKKDKMVCQTKTLTQCQNRKEVSELYSKTVIEIAEKYLGQGLGMSELVKAGNEGARKWCGRNEDQFEKQIARLRHKTKKGKDSGPYDTPHEWIRQSIVHAILKIKCDRCDDKK